MRRGSSGVRAADGAAVGIGFITWHLARHPDRLQVALARKPVAVMLSFGDPTPFVPPIRAAGARLILQVQTLADARAAAALGADVVVAQGAEAGGHGAKRGRCRSCRRWSMRSPRRRSPPPAGSPMAGAWPRSCSALRACSSGRASTPPGGARPRRGQGSSGRGRGRRDRPDHGVRSGAGLRLAGSLHRACAAEPAV